MESREYQDVPSERWGRLWNAVVVDVARHPVDLATLGEYAILARRRDRRAAANTFPSVDAHLATGCPTCTANLRELTAFAEDEVRQELAFIGVGVQRGFLVPLGPRLRGRTVDPPATSEGSPDSSPPLVYDSPLSDFSSFDLFDRAIVHAELAARIALADQYSRIVATWIRRDRSWSSLAGAADQLAARVWERFWSAVGADQFPSLPDLLSVLVLLKDEAHAAVIEAGQRRERPLDNDS